MEEVVAFITSPGMITSFLVIVGVVVLWAVLRRLLRRYMASCKSRDGDGDNKRERFAKTLYVAVKYLLMLVTLIIVLQVNGVNVGTLVTGLGIVGIVVGFALQDTLKDAIMGVHIVTDHFFTVGDVVKYQGIEGEVITITPQTTKLRDIATNNIMSISNRNISEITVLSPLVDIDLPLSYDEDVPTVHEVLGRLCEQVKQVEGVEDCVYKGTQSFEDSAIVYKIRFFCQPKNKPEVRRSVLKVIQAGLGEADIEIPYNQLDVHQK